MSFFNLQSSPWLFYSLNIVSIMSTNSVAVAVAAPVEDLSAAEYRRTNRLIAANGAEATAYVMKMKIVIVGLRGIGIETVSHVFRTSE